MNQFLTTRNMDSTGTGMPPLQFKHPHATLKAFIDFIDQFEFRYNAQYPEPSRNAIDNANLKWKAWNKECEPTEKDIETVQDDFFHLLVYNTTRKLLNLIQSFWQMLKWTIFQRKWDYIINILKIKLYKILNFDKLQIAQTKHLVHFTTTLKLQEKLVRFVAKKTPAKPMNTQYGTN